MLFFFSGEREARLSSVKKQMQTQPVTTRVHFEMASFSEPHLMNYLMDNIIPYADSLGMNEQVGGLLLFQIFYL